MKDRIGSAPGDADRLLFPAVETHLIPSKHVRQTFRLQVMQPGRRPGDTRRVPVVYATDANWTFNMFREMSHLLQMSEHDAPPFMLVGIGYPGDAPHAGFFLRARDYTYPPYPQWGGLPAVPWDGVLTAEQGSKDFFGAQDFRHFIGEELIPFIESTYAMASSERILFGHSGGGFFGLFTLLTQPELFNSYIVSSPGVIWNGEAPGGGPRYENYEFGLQMVRDFAATGRALEGIRLYLSAGSEEEFEPTLANWRLTSSLIRLVKVFRDAAIPGLMVMSEIIPDETHISVWPVAFTHGVQAMLGTRHVQRVVYR